MKRFLKSALAVLPLVMLASCAADDDIVVDDGIAKKSETRYLRVTLSSANGAPETRGPGDLEATDGSYAEGTEAENKIRTLEFYFYDRNKQFHSYRSMISNSDKAVTPTDVNDPNRPNVDAFYECNVPVELIQGETYPQYVICIINSVEGTSYQEKSMEDAQSALLADIYGSVKDGDTRYFGMSNSVYYGVDKVTGGDGQNQLIMATPFETTMLKTATEIQSMIDGAKSETYTGPNIEDYTVNIYVERYAAKVNLDLASTTVAPYTSGDKKLTVNFVPKKWGVNCVEKNFFFLKAYRTIGASTPASPAEGVTDIAYGNEFETYETLNSFLFKGWNNEAHHRSFWARTPGYYMDSYPVVSDDIKDNGGAANFPLDYLSYNQLNDVDANWNNSYSAYTKETTMKKDRLTGENMSDQYLPTASLPSVVIAGQYMVDGQTKPIDLYAYGKSSDGKANFYTGETDAIEGIGKIRDAMLDAQSILLKRSESGTDIEGNPIYTYENYKLSSINDAKLRDKFEVSHPSADVRSTVVAATAGQASGSAVKVAADVVVLQILSSVTEADNLYFYNSASGMYEHVSKNLNIANRLLLQNLGGAHFYKDGMAFFTAPIQHWGWYRADNENRFKPIKDDKGNVTGYTNETVAMVDWDWSKMKTGDFGVVRNHVYSMNIGKIEGLGTGIKNPDEPIVPPADKVAYEVHFHVNIQKWAVLPVQNWNF